MSRLSGQAWGQFHEAMGLRESPLGIYYANEQPVGKTPKAGMAPGVVLEATHENVLQLVPLSALKRHAADAG